MRTAHNTRHFKLGWFTYFQVLFSIGHGEQVTDSLVVDFHVRAFYFVLDILVSVLVNPKKHFIANPGNQTFFGGGRKRKANEQGGGNVNEYAKKKKKKRKGSKTTTAEIMEMTRKRTAESLFKAT